MKSNTKTVKDGSQHNKRKQILIILTLIVLLCFTGVFSLVIGKFDIKLWDIFNLLISRLFSLSDSMSALNADVIFKLRIPRVLWALVAGMGLSLTGALMQTVLRNPLASPFTLGISAGANFGVAFAIVVGFSAMGHIYSIVLCAFLGAIGTSMMIIGISSLKGSTIQILVLAGIALNFILGSSSEMLEYMATPEQLESTRAFSRGELGAFGYYELSFVATILIAGLILLVPMILDLNVIIAGDERASSLGIKTGNLRMKAMVISSVIVASIVAFVGPIGFIGLISPHLVRSLVGVDHKYYLPGSALMGALILLLADMLGMTILGNTVVPVGVMTSFIGVPFFLYITIKERRRFW